MRKKTLEEFIQEAREVHGDLYDYSEVVYNGVDTKIKIKCKEHGIFEQRPKHHIKRKQGCSVCSGNKKKTTEEFIKEAIKIHGYLYDYSRVNYTGSKNKVEIICKKHGIFNQTPCAHINERGCPRCVGKSKTTEIYIQEASKVHGDLYDYSKVNYINSDIKIEIICKKHGSFLQDPSSHLTAGSGCSNCFGNTKKNTEQFIIDAIKIHGDLYSYSKSKYVNNRSPIEIICKKHGSFYQTPTCHLRGFGCSSCSGNTLKTTEQFIKDAMKIHGDKYDYSQVNYINAKTLVSIICPKHGIFKKTPNDHLCGSGCSKCNNKTEGKIYNYLVENYDCNIRHDRTLKEYINKRRFDFVINNEIIIECDGDQHFIGKKKSGNRIKISSEEQIEIDILKMKATINNFAIIRLVQRDVWEDKYDWKSFIDNAFEVAEVGKVYISKHNKDYYDNHVGFEYVEL